MNLSELQEPSEPALLQQESVQGIRCSQNGLAVCACFNKACQKYAFMCQDKGCACRNDHQGCLIVEVDHLVRNFKSRIHGTQALQDSVNQSIDKLIDYLSELRQSTIQSIQQSFNCYGLNQSQSHIIHQIQAEQVAKITGKVLFEGYSTLKEKQDVQKDLKRIIRRVQTSFSSFEKQTLKLKASLDKAIQSHIVKIKTAKQNDCLFGESKIINKVEQSTTLMQFFSSKTILSVELLYRASQNTFEISKFHQKCDNIPNTLIIIDQQFGNKIGGYTPLCWQYIKPEEKKQNFYKPDESKESFLFSLPNKDKLTLSKPESAIQIRNDHVVKFGDGTDLYLSDKANQNNKSFSSICHSYTNPNYKQNDKSSKGKFLGSSNGEYYFKVKEWEVWKLEFA